MKPRIAQTRRTTYVDDANISYATSYSEGIEESWLETESRQSKQMLDRLSFPRWSLMRPSSVEEGVRKKSGAVTRLVPAKSRIGTGYTNNIANFRGTGHRIGNKAKQMTKQAKAATLQAPKTSRRSHLLTNARKEVSV